MIPFLITASRIDGGFAYIQLDQIATIEDTADLIGKEFVIPIDQLIQPDEDSYYPFQIIGLDVFTEENEYLGKVSEIYINSNRSIYEIKMGKKEYLVPAAKHFIKKIDLVEKKIIIHVVDGLLE